VLPRSLAELCTIPLRGSTDRLWSLDELLKAVDGRVPLVIEVKSSFSGAFTLLRRVADRLMAYRGTVGVKSFDPRLIAELRTVQPYILRGVIGCAFPADDPEWAELSAGQRWALRHLAHLPQSRPDFLSWDVHDLPRSTVTVAQKVLRLPVMSWTVRSPSDQARAAMHADQMVFEGFVPAAVGSATR
jgi:glycerophosphoryl diester phosphodiesterase